MKKSDVTMWQTRNKERVHVCHITDSTNKNQYLYENLNGGKRGSKHMSE